MIRPLTLLGGIAFLAAGLYVFQTKEEVARMERDLRELHRTTEAERARTRLLAAEWARLNDQDRLRSLAQTHLREMQPMEPQQFVRLEDAHRRLPGAQAFAATGANAFRTRGDLPSAPGEVLVFRAGTLLAVAEPPAAEPPPRVAAQAAPERGSAQAAPERGPVQAAPERASAPAAPERSALQAAPEPPAEAPRVAAPRPAPRPAEPPVVEAAAPVAAPRPRPELAALPPIAGPPVPAARPAPAPAVARAEPPARAPAPPLRTAAHVQPAPPLAPVGSLLGSGTALPPPVPFAR